ncbi:MAG: BtpA/SgcQ family protein [Anaerolineales bacterium]|nr:BtpA/SgcQ family protein [Anaerolineales bacterium]
MLTPLFARPKPVIAMIHIAALPGTPANTLRVSEIVDLAVREARLYQAAGVDGLGIENMHDLPYLRAGVGPEIVAAMTLCGQAVKAETGLPVGVQVLAGANQEAMAVAHAAGLDFIRAEGFVFAHVADEGLIESSAAQLLRYRKLIGAERVQVWTDVKKKHSAHAITADVSLGLTAEAAEFMRASAVIITGSVTGDPCRIEDVAEARAHCGLPIVLGSGVTTANLARFYAAADAMIVGTHFKVDGRWTNTVDPRRVEAFVTELNRLRAT